MEAKIIVKKYWWAIALVIVLVAVAVWYFFFKEKESPILGQPTGDTNKEEQATNGDFYASKETKALIASQKASGKLEDYGIGLGASQWRWDVFCAQCAQVFGAEWAGCNWEQANGKPINGAKVLAWFHGMNVNPVTGSYETTIETGYNGLFRNAGVVADIKKFLFETFEKPETKIYGTGGVFLNSAGAFLPKIK